MDLKARQHCHNYPAALLQVTTVIFQKVVQMCMSDSSYPLDKHFSLAAMPSARFPLPSSVFVCPE